MSATACERSGVASIICVVVSYGFTSDNYVTTFRGHDATLHLIEILADPQTILSLSVLLQNRQ